MMVFTLKHVGAVLMQILIILLKQFSCASVGEKNVDNIKMHGTTIKISVLDVYRHFELIFFILFNLTLSAK